jgi:hypothetical protein
MKRREKLLTLTTERKCAHAHLELYLCRGDQPGPGPTQQVEPLTCALFNNIIPSQCKDKTNWDICSISPSSIMDEKRVISSPSHDRWPVWYDVIQYPRAAYQMTDLPTPRPHAVISHSDRRAPILSAARSSKNKNKSPKTKKYIIVPPNILRTVQSF